MGDEEPRTGPELLRAVRGRMARNYDASKFTNQKASSRRVAFMAAKRDVNLLVTEVVRLSKIIDVSGYHDAMSSRGS